ncbi:MAG: DUF4405 domain-containing protein [Candidatus Omnitrophica bacterium]|nr:DUF4405 domain-containing protein [Candidatus Omnitrophota bacterium]
MNKAKLMKVVNPLLLLSAIIQMLTGVFLFFNLFAKQLSFMSSLHEYNGIIFTALVLIHIWLNWRWFSAVFFKKAK